MDRRIKKIRILYGLEAADSGALKHLSYLVTNLNKELFDITVILSTRRSREYAHRHILRMRRAGAKVVILPMERDIHPWKDLVCLLRIILHLVRNRYDIVHAHSSKAGVLFRLAAWIRRVPYVFYTPHCFYFQGMTGTRKGVYSFVERCMAAITDHIVVSDNERDWAIRCRIAGREKLLTINNAIDFAEYAESRKKDILKQELGLDRGTIVIGAIGRLAEQKDWLTYIYAAKETVERFPETAFLIVGEGELEDFLRDTIEYLGMSEKIIFTGFHDRINEVYSVIDIFVSTSLWEGLPYVLLEAMRFRKPVIATDLGYAGFIKESENGFLVAARDHSLIAKRIGQLIGDRSLGRRMGEKGYDLVCTQFSFEQFVKQHEQAYSSVIKVVED